MNKKYLMFGIPLLCLVVVSAAIISHYGLFEQEINVTNPVSVEGKTTTLMECLSGELCLGSLITISNVADFDVEVDISNDAPVGVDVAYLSKLQMETKDVEWVITGNPVDLFYTIIGNKFVYKTDVDTGYEDYVIIYYPDVDGNPGSWNIDEAIYLGDVTTDLTISDLSESLPIDTDFNDAAKLWIIPEADWTAKSWNPTAWLFEHNLIKYNKADAGTTNVESNSSLEVYPVYMPDTNFEGSATITTTIAP